MPIYCYSEYNNAPRHSKICYRRSSTARTFREMELTMHLPCTHLSPASTMENLDESIMKGTCTIIQQYYTCQMLIIRSGQSLRPCGLAPGSPFRSPYVGSRRLSTESIRAFVPRQAVSWRLHHVTLTLTPWVDKSQQSGPVQMSVKHREPESPSVGRARIDVRHRFPNLSACGQRRAGFQNQHATADVRTLSRHPLPQAQHVLCCNSRVRD